MSTPDTYLVSGLVAGMPAHLCFDTRYEADTWINFCAKQYANEDVRVFVIVNYAQLAPLRKELQ